MKWKTRIAHIRRARARKGAGSVTTRDREAGEAAAGAGTGGAASADGPGAGRRPAPKLERGTQKNADRASGRLGAAAGQGGSEGGAGQVGAASSGASMGDPAPLPLSVGGGFGYPRSTDQHISVHDHGRGANQPDGGRSGGAGGGRAGRADGHVEVGGGGELSRVAVAEPAGASGAAAGFRGSRRAERRRVRSFGRPGRFGGSCAFYGGPGFGRRLEAEPGRAASAGTGGSEGGLAVAGDELSASPLAGKPVLARVSGDRARGDTLYIMRILRGTGPVASNPPHHRPGS